MLDELDAANQVIILDHEVGHQKFKNRDDIDESTYNKGDGKRRSSWLLALTDLYVETFSPLFLLLPIMFVHIGFMRATIVFTIVWLL